MVVVDWGYLAPLCATGVPRVTGSLIRAYAEVIAQARCPRASRH